MPSISPRKNRAGTVSWVVDCGLVTKDGKTTRERHFFKTKVLAEAEADHEKVMTWVLRKALKPYLERPLSDITVNVLETLLQQTKTQSTRARWLAAYNGLFDYASMPGRDYISHNPVLALVKTPKFGAWHNKAPVYILPFDNKRPPFIR